MSWTKALLAAVGAALVVAPAPAAGADADRAAAYLEQAQNRDGGLGMAPGSGSSPQETVWSALGLSAAGRDVARVRRRGGRSLLAAVRGEARRARTVGDLERAILAIAAADRTPDPALVARLLAERRPDGSFAGQTVWTSFAVLALRAAGRPAGDPDVLASTAFLAGLQNPDGGFGFAAGGRSGVDETAAAVQALVAAGRAEDAAAVERAVGFLLAAQRPDGGFPLAPGGPSNAQSTSWAVQALVAAGHRSLSGPLRYLRRLQAPDGSIRYSRTSRQTPVWVTAQALTALSRAPFPL